MYKNNKEGKEDIEEDRAMLGWQRSGLGHLKKGVYITQNVT